MNASVLCCSSPKSGTNQRGRKSTIMVASPLQRIAFYPSLLYNVLVEKVTTRTRYNRIDNFVLLGGLPFRSLKSHLIQNERVKGVIAMNEDFELRRFVPKEHEWKSDGVQYLSLPTPDYVASPSQEFIKKGVNFILDHKSRGDTVYVHCKAGRTRSATIVACYMMTAYNLTPAEAVDAVKQKRAHIWLRETQLQSIRCYYVENIEKQMPNIDKYDSKV